MLEAEISYQETHVRLKPEAKTKARLDVKKMKKQHNLLFFIRFAPVQTRRMRGQCGCSFGCSMNRVVPPESRLMKDRIARV